VFEHKSDKYKICGHGNSQYSNGGKFTAETQPEEGIEKYDMQEIVYQMSPPEANAILGRSFLFEGEVSCQIIVDKETENISDGIGYVNINPVLEYPINDIVDGCCRRAHNAKPEQFSKSLLFIHIFLNYGAKLQIILYS